MGWVRARKSFFQKTLEARRGAFGQVRGGLGDEDWIPAEDAGMTDWARRGVLGTASGTRQASAGEGRRSLWRGMGGVRRRDLGGGEGRAIAWADFLGGSATTGGRKGWEQSTRSSRRGEDGGGGGERRALGRGCEFTQIVYNIGKRRARGIGTGGESERWRARDGGEVGAALVRWDRSGRWVPADDAGMTGHGGRGAGDGRGVRCVQSVAAMCSVPGRKCSFPGPMCSRSGRMCSLWRGRCSVEEGQRGEGREVSVGGGSSWSGWLGWCRGVVRRAQDGVFGDAGMTGMCPLGQADVSCCWLEVSAFRPDVFSFEGNVSTLARQVSSEEGAREAK